MIKTVYYECGCVIAFIWHDNGEVSIDPEFTLCYKHGFKMYEDKK